MIEILFIIAVVPIVLAASCLAALTVAPAELLEQIFDPIFDPPEKEADE